MFFAIIYKYINTHNQNIKHKSALKERKIEAYTEMNISSEEKKFENISNFCRHFKLLWNLDQNDGISHNWATTSYNIKITLKSLFGMKMLRFCDYVCNDVIDLIT